MPLTPPEYMEKVAARLRTAGRSLMVAAHGHAPSPPLDEVRELSVAGGGEALPARLYVPEGAPGRGPAMVYFHGGGFFSCSIDTHDGMCRWIAAFAGVRVVSVGYRLAPEHRFPAQIDDAEAAARDVLRRAAELGVDPEAFALGGDSAGGFLAATTALVLNAEAPGAVKIMLLIYPMARIDAGEGGSETALAFRLLGQAAARIVQSQVLPPGAEAYGLPEDLSPAPRVVLVSGGLDPLRAEAEDLGRAFEAAGATVVRFFYPRLVHGGLNFPGVAGAAFAWLAEVSEALGAGLRAAADESQAPADGPA